jgi:hypothetical protein
MGEAKQPGRVSRRTALGLVSVAGATAFLPTRAQAQQSGPDRWALGSPPVRIPDPDVLVLDPAFAPLTVPNALIERAWTGGDWLEGPAWSNGGRFLVFSDVRRDCQYRMLWENGARIRLPDPLWQQQWQHIRSPRASGDLPAPCAPGGACGA